MLVSSSFSHLYALWYLPSTHLSCLCPTLSQGKTSTLRLHEIIYLQVYFDFMRSFHTEFRNLSEEGLISAIEIGLGASGELRYPSFPERMGWKYPGIGEFQVFTRT